MTINKHNVLIVLFNPIIIGLIILAIDLFMHLCWVNDNNVTIKTRHTTTTVTNILEADSTYCIELVRKKIRIVFAMIRYCIEIYVLERNGGFSVCCVG